MVAARSSVVLRVDSTVGKTADSWAGLSAGDQIADWRLGSAGLSAASMASPTVNEWAAQLAEKSFASKVLQWGSTMVVMTVVTTLGYVS